MSGIDVNSLANAWRKVRDDVNVLSWLFEEERVIQRLYIESVFWALSGTRLSVEEFANQVGLVVTDQSSVNDK